MNNKIEIYTPVDLDDLVKKIDREKRKFHFLVGGTDLFPMINRGILHPRLLINLNSLKSSLDFIKLSSEHIEIGALANLQKIIDYTPFEQGIKKIPTSLYKALSSIGSVQIRNLATLAGNIANASPAADSIPALLVENGKINLLSTEGMREIDIDKFYQGYKKTAMRQNEVIYSINFNSKDNDSISNFIKIGTRSAMTISKLSFAYNIFSSRVFFAAGSVSPFPKRLVSLEKHWFNPDLTLGGIEKIIKDEISPIDDIRSTAHYRIKVLTNIIFQLYLNNNFVLKD